MRTSCSNKRTELNGVPTVSGCFPLHAHPLLYKMFTKMKRLCKFLVSPSFKGRIIFLHLPISGMTFFNDRISAIISRMTIEPIVFFNYLALSFFHVSQNAVLYRSVCIQNYGQYDANIDCDHLRFNGPELEDRVQKDTSMWNMILSLCYLLPSVASDLILGALSDRHGRKVNILIGLTGLIVACVASIALAIFPLTPLYVLCVAKVFAGLCGYIAIVMISSWAYLADVLENKRELTSRMMSVQVFRFVADVLGSFSFSSLSRRTNLAVTLLLAQCFFVVAFFYALARLYQMPPMELKKFMQRRRKGRTIHGADHLRNEIDKLKSNGAESDESISGSKTSLIRERTKTEGNCEYIWHLYEGVWRTLIRQRPRNERIYILLACLIYFAFMMSEIGLQGSILSLYVFHRPFFWSPSALGTFKGVQQSFALVINLFGALLLNEFVHAEDTSIMLLGLGSGIIHLTLTGLAKDSCTLYVGAFMASFGSLLVPSLKSFMVRIVGEDEVGKTLAANGIAADLAFVASALVFTNLYTITVSTYAGAVFYAGAISLTFCFFATIWIKYDQKRGRLELRENLLI